MSWEIVIGIETHVQLATNSKIFSNAATAFGAPPNSQASVVDLALPGTLPVLNSQAVQCAIKFGLAVNAGRSDHIARRSVFARKNYFYPDLPKGYQISQFELPVVTGGSVTFYVDGVEKVVKLTRAHLEEDAGKSLHEGLDTAGVSGIDLNRAGTPLLEVVSEPDMRSAAEAVAYAKALHGIVTWIGVCDGNMQEGSFRCDANVSVRKVGAPLGTRCEIKNLNSFRFMEKAINFEVRRQIELIEDGGKVIQQTRLYDADRDETRAMRSKEDAMDYRYFPDPDLLPLAITQDQVNEVRQEMLLNEADVSSLDIPATMASWLAGAYGISATDARAVTVDNLTCSYFRGVADNGPRRYIGEGRSVSADPKLCVNFVLSEFNRKRNEYDDPQWMFWVSDDAAGRLLERVYDGTIGLKVAKGLYSELWDQDRRLGAMRGPDAVDEIISIRKRYIRTNLSLSVRADGADAIIAARGLKQVSDPGAIEKIVDDVLANNEKSVAEFKSGKEKALQALVGQVMKASQGKANPSQVNDILRKKLAE